MTKIFTLSNSKHLEKGLTHPIGKWSLERFSDGEVKPKLLESVRGHRVIILGSLKSEDLIELIMLADALKRSAAKEIIGFFPYLLFMRQDRQDEPRTPIGAKAIARVIEVSGIDQVITLDLHANQIEGFFDIPVTHIMGNNIFVPHIAKNYDTSNSIIVSPDFGGGKRAGKLAREFNLPVALINKEREKANIISNMDLIGDVSGKDVIIYDDMVDTAGSLVTATDLLLQEGANSVKACITHGVLSGPAIERINSSNLEKLIISDSINNSSKNSDKIDIISCNSVFDDVIRTIINSQSVNEMLENNYRNS